jgi:hypothetical protein
MNRRPCACGTPIVAADVDGWTVWLSRAQPGRGTHSLDGEHTTLDLAGDHAKHACAADQRRVDIDAPAPRDTVARDIAAAQAVLNARHTLTEVQEKAARYRVANPDLSGRQVARNAGLSNYVFHTAFRRIREHANRITTIE